jgi:hypothetical protein
LANAARGLAFERAVIAALNAAKNKTKIHAPGLGRSIPDILNEGVTRNKERIGNQQFPSAESTGRLGQD